MAENNSLKNCSSENNDQKTKVNRRDFFRVGAAGTALGVGAVLTQKKELSAKAAAKTIVKEHDNFPVEVKDSYRPMDQRNIIFSRAYGGFDKGLLKYAKMFKAQTPRKEEGWTHLDRALNQASWSVHDAFSPASAAGLPNTPAFAWEGPLYEKQYKFKNKKQASKIIKKAAKHFGASLVGITPYDERWQYNPMFDIRTKKTYTPDDFPFKPKSVIVMALEMEYEGFGTAPSWIASATAGIRYSNMAALGYSLATFIRQLGYKAFGAGNDIALSIPYAVAAGLGECGRNGVLITYEYGPRVRLCKVFTELELEYDKPKTFGVIEFCKNCKRCADACPSKAISQDDNPSFTKLGVSNNGGVEKWCLDAEKCYAFWGENGGDCGACIASCPYNKPDFWHHKMTNWISKFLPGQGHAFMRQMDIAFGYGNTYDKKAIRNWWKKG